MNEINIATLTAILSKEEIKLIENYISPVEDLRSIFKTIELGNHSDYDFMTYVYSSYKQFKSLKDKLTAEKQRNEILTKEMNKSKDKKISLEKAIEIINSYFAGEGCKDKKCPPLSCKRCVIKQFEDIAE